MQTLKNRNNTNRRRNQDPRNILTIIDYGIETTQPEDSAKKEDETQGKKRREKRHQHDEKPKNEK